MSPSTGQHRAKQNKKAGKLLRNPTARGEILTFKAIWISIINVKVAGYNYRERKAGAECNLSIYN